MINLSVFRYYVFIKFSILSSFAIRIANKNFIKLISSIKGKKNYEYLLLLYLKKKLTYY